MSIDGSFVNSTIFPQLYFYVFDITLCYLMYFRIGVANYSCYQIHPVVYLYTAWKLKNGFYVFKEKNTRVHTWPTEPRTRAVLTSAPHGSGPSALRGSRSRSAPLLSATRGFQKLAFAVFLKTDPTLFKLKTLFLNWKYVNLEYCGSRSNPPSSVKLAVQW